MLWSDGQNTLKYDELFNKYDIYLAKTGHCDVSTVLLRAKSTT